MTGHAHGSGFAKSACRSGPVNTATTPGRARAALVSIERMRAWASGRAHDAQMERAEEDDVVGEA